jgi:hypothetical protein
MQLRTSLLTGRHLERLSAIWLGYRDKPLHFHISKVTNFHFLFSKSSKRQVFFFNFWHINWIKKSDSGSFLNFSEFWNFKYKGQSYPCNRMLRLIELWDVEAPTFSRQLAHRWQWGCQPSKPVPLNPSRRFQVLIYVRRWVDTRAIAQLEGLHELRNSMPSLGIEPTTFQLVSCTLHLDWYVYHITICGKHIIINLLLQSTLTYSLWTEIHQFVHFSALITKTEALSLC